MKGLLKKIGIGAAIAIPTIFAIKGEIRNSNQAVDLAIARSKIAEETSRYDRLKSTFQDYAHTARAMEAAQMVYWCSVYGPNGIARRYGGHTPISELPLDEQGEQAKSEWAAKDKYVHELRQRMSETERECGFKTWSRDWIEIAEQKGTNGKESILR